MTEVSTRLKSAKISLINPGLCTVVLVRCQTQHMWYLYRALRGVCGNIEDAGEVGAN